MRYTTFRNTAVGAVVVVVAGVVGAYMFLRSNHKDDVPANTSTDTKALAEDSVPWKKAAPPPTQVDAATFENNLASAKPQPLVDTDAATNAIAHAVTPTKATAAADANGLRDVDHDVLDLVKTAATGEKMKDAAKGKPYKIDLHSDDGKAWNRVKIDLNRNGKWDEKWSLKDSKWHREVASADDENYDAKYVLDASGWRKK